ncbi:hypothetical protein ACB092_11G196600 [Castanea dentata]
MNTRVLEARFQSEYRVSNTRILLADLGRFCHIYRSQVLETRVFGEEQIENDLKKNRSEDARSGASKNLAQSEEARSG